MNEKTKKIMQRATHLTGVIDAELAKITDAAKLNRDHPLAELIEVVTSATSSLRYYENKKPYRDRTDEETLADVIGAMEITVTQIQEIGEGLREIEYEAKKSVEFVLEYGLKVTREVS